MPSTSTPKICCVVTLSLIWKRGSAPPLVDSISSSRPSIVSRLTSCANETTKRGGDGWARRVQPDTSEASATASQIAW